MHRVGGGPAVEHREDRPQRDLLLRDEPVARGRPAPAAPGRHVRVGGRRRLLPGRHPPRRDPLLVLDELVRQAGHRGPARGGGEGPAPPGHRGDRRRAGDAHRRRTGGRAGPVRRADPLAPAQRRVPPGAVGGLGADHRPVPDRRQLGRAGPAHPRQLRGLHAGRGAAQVAGGPRPGALDPLLHRLRSGPAETVLRLLPARRRQPLARPAAGPAAGPPAGRVHPAGRAGVAAGPHQLAAALPAAGLGRAERGRGHRPGAPVLPRGRGRGHVHRGPGRAGDGDHRPGGGPPVRLLHHHRRRPVLRAAGAAPGWPGSHLHRRHRPAHPGRAGLAPPVAPQARPGAEHPLPAVPQPR
jgi:hypothetical protein